MILLQVSIRTGQPGHGRQYSLTATGYAGNLGGAPMTYGAFDCDADCNARPVITVFDKYKRK
jgi:hypothetical protein